MNEDLNNEKDLREKQLGRRNSNYKSPEARMSFLCLGDSTKAIVAVTECLWRTLVKEF